MIATLLVCLSAVQAIFAFTPRPLTLSSNYSSLSRKINNDYSSSTGVRVAVEEEANESRRAFLTNAVVTGLTGLTPLIISSSNPQITYAAESTQSKTLTSFKDSNVGFEFQVPTTWTKSEQTLPDRRKILLFVNNGDNGEQGGNVAKGLEDLIFVAYTTVRDDFTSLGSFGTVDQVGQATILPKGQLAGLETENVMLSSESKKNAYYFDYTSKTPDQPKRHFRTIFTLIQGATGGAGSVLVTITAQTLESRYTDEMKAMFDEIIDSYRKI